MNANAFLQKDYENETTLRPQKNKPKQTQFQKIVMLKLRILLRTLFIKSLSLLSASQRFAADKTMRKPRSLRIKKLTIVWTGANLKNRRVI